MANRMYNVVAYNRKTGMLRKANKTPMTHQEACTFKSKFTSPASITLRLEEVSNQQPTGN